MKTPALTIPGAMEGLEALVDAIEKSGVPRTVLELTNLRAGQINGCSVCVDMHARALRKLGEKEERIFCIGAWRETPYYNDAERAALALTEAATRLAHRSHPVPDDVWNEAARHFEEKQLGGLVLSIGLINLWNRLNAMTRQISGHWVQEYVR
jgi:AhpD family alkylhydroperoxidase